MKYLCKEYGVDLFAHEYGHTYHCKFRCKIKKYGLNIWTMDDLQRFAKNKKQQRFFDTLKEKNGSKKEK